jgi:hypothetical protein
MAAGVQHFSWDLQYAPVTPFPGMVLWGATTTVRWRCRERIRRG